MHSFEMMDLPFLIAGLVTFAEVAGGLGILIGGFGQALIALYFLIMGNAQPGKTS